MRRHSREIFPRYGSKNSRFRARAGIRLERSSSVNAAACNNRAIITRISNDELGCAIDLTTLR
jgi:hypothetical protein